MSEEDTPALDFKEVEELRRKMIEKEEAERRAREAMEEGEDDEQNESDESSCQERDVSQDDEDY